MFLSMQRNSGNSLLAFLIGLDFLFVENGKDVYLHGANNSSLFGSENFTTPVFFLLLDGAVQYSEQ